MTDEQKALARKSKSAKEWNHMYDANHKLLFNPCVFPDDMLQGKMIGLYMIHELHLFDRDLKPQNIAFSHSGADSHNIILRPNRPKGFEKTAGTPDIEGSIKAEDQMEQSFAEARASAQFTKTHESLNEGSQAKPSNTSGLGYDADSYSH